jgi:GNAT superfamily N-acetyltransferase
VSIKEKNMEITYKFSNDKSEYWNMALTALRNKLHVQQPSYMMKETFGEIMREDMTPKGLGIAFCDNKPVGEIIIHEIGLIMTYVRKQFRHKGIGSNLISGAKSKTVGNLHALPGIVGSDKFYIKNGFLCEKPY